MKLSSKKVSFELNDKLADFDCYLNTPFILFEKKNLLNKSAYDELVNELYSMEEFEYQLSGRGDKKRTAINGSHLTHLKEGVFKDLCTAFISKNFYSWFCRTHLPYFNDCNIRFYLQRPSSLVSKVLRKIKRAFKIPVSFYFTEVEYSSITKGGYIIPHTDAKNKRLSFVYYIPSPSQPLSSDEKKDLGTIFWGKKNGGDSFERFDSGFLSEDDLKSFYLNYHESYIASYEENKFAGFIKNDISWHSVKINNHEYDRRVIVINVYEA